MARIRSVKPDIWTDPDFCDMSIPARLFLIGTFNFADDWGLLADDPRRLRLQIFPNDPELDAEALVRECVDHRFLVRLVSPKGERLLRIRTFTVHQKIDRRGAGRWGNPEEWPESPPIPTTPAELPPTPPLEGNGREGNNLCSASPAEQTLGASKNAAAPTPSSRFDEDFQQWWSGYPRKRDKAAALKAYKARRREGAEASRLLAAVGHFAPAMAGKDPEHIKLGATFLAKDGPWTEWANGNPDRASTNGQGPAKLGRSQLTNDFRDRPWIGDDE